MENPEERRRKWFEAASALTRDPTTRVLCPDCGKSFLVSIDERVDASHVDRRISCTDCGARESIFINTELRRIQ